MSDLERIRNAIKTLKIAKDILQKEYENSEFHKKKEAHPQETVPPSPEDEEIYKLLTAIQQLDFYVKKFQEDQFNLLKQHGDK
ncbi:MAG: hypothetical protein JSW62_05960 [Thermoplasmatales archaeon]|nr:MAG: hypothetical protein JSW62_05960 [Thermoplasmatales archaeon]